MTSMRGPSPEASGHTPGSWDIRSRIDGNMPIDVGSPSTYVCTVHGSTKAEVVANAHLIAAAPDLLSALRALLATSDLNFDSLEPDTVRAIQAARAVIAKVGA